MVKVKKTIFQNQWLFSSLDKYNPYDDKRNAQVLPIVILLMEHEFTHQDNCDYTGC
jgi:hypothetical protein